MVHTNIILKDMSMKNNLITASGVIFSWNNMKSANSIKENIHTFILSEDNFSHFEDTSITKFVNNKIHFSKLDYIPGDLVSITGNSIIDSKWNQTLRKEAYEHLEKLSQDFYKHFKIKVKIISAYRSYTYQKWIKNRWCSSLFCANPGYSEHQSWLAVDVFEASSQKEFLSKPNLKKYFLWLQMHAYKYWFHNSYQKGENIDGYAVEPWHWRYLWIDFATELQQNNMTYWEYFIKNWEK